VQKDYAGAIEHYLRHVESHSEDTAKAYSKVAQCYLNTNILDHPKNITPALSLVFQSDEPSAKQYYLLALEYDPNHYASMCGLAGFLPEGSDEQFELLERAAAKQPGLLILTDLGDLYRSKKNFERAYDLYCQAVKHKPKDQTAYKKLNDLCRRMGNPDEVKEWSQRWRDIKGTRRRVDGR